MVGSSGNEIGTLGSDNQTCCYGEYAWSGTGYDTLAYSVCGCPEEGTYKSTGYCCYNGMIWNDGYSEADYEACGSCPQGGHPGKDGKTCCDGNLAWDSD